jgi:hypothetical protein
MLTVSGTGPRRPSGQVSVKLTVAPVAVAFTSVTGLPHADSTRAWMAAGLAEDWAALIAVVMVTVAVPVKEVPGVMVAGTSMAMLPWT